MKFQIFILVFSITNNLLLFSRAAQACPEAFSYEAANKKLRLVSEKTGEIIEFRWNEKNASWVFDPKVVAPRNPEDYTTPVDSLINYDFQSYGIHFYSEKGNREYVLIDGAPVRLIEVLPMSEHANNPMEVVRRYGMAVFSGSADLPANPPRQGIVRYEALAKSEFSNLLRANGVEAHEEVYYVNQENGDRIIYFESAPERSDLKVAQSIAFQSALAKFDFLDQKVGNESLRTFVRILSAQLATNKYMSRERGLMQLIKAIDLEYCAENPAMNHVDLVNFLLAIASPSAPAPRSGDETLARFDQVSSTDLMRAINFPPTHALANLIATNPEYNLARRVFLGHLDHLKP